MDLAATPTRQREPLLALLLWTSVVAAFAAHFRLHYAVEWAMAFRWAAIDWYVWAGLSVGVHHLSSRLADAGWPIWGKVALHGVAMWVVVGLQVALVILIDGLIPPAASLGFGEHFVALFGKKLGVNVVAYIAVVAASQLLLTRPRAQVADPAAPSARPLESLLVERLGREHLVDVRAVRYLEAAGNYVSIHAGGGPYLVRRTLSSLAEELEPLRFARISRSLLVNLDVVEAVEPDTHGACRVVLDDQSVLRMTRLHRRRFLARYGPRP